jgi:glycosyltransferase involved in cell wall biosynthesis
MPEQDDSPAMPVAHHSEGRAERRFLVILYGEIEYDGRAQRMLEVLSSLGNVLLVDVSLNAGAVMYTRQGVRHSRVDLSGCKGKARRHLRLWIHAMRVAQSYDPHVVVAENFFTTLPAWIVARRAGARLVYDAYELIIPDRGTRMSRRDAFWYFMERWVVKRNDLTIAANPERARLMAEHYGLERLPEYMRNIPPVPDPGASDDLEVDERYPELAPSADGGTTILYQGNVSLSRGLKRFVESLELLPATYRLIVVGDGPDLEQLKQIGARWAQEERFIALGRVPNALLPAITRRADLGIVTYPSEGLNNIYCAPNKLFEYAQSGLPVIATDHPILKALVEQHGIGVLVNHAATPGEVAAALEQLVENIEDYRANLACFVDAHRWDAEADRIRRAIRAAVVMKQRHEAWEDL